MEQVYQTLVHRDLARLGVEDDFYPVGYSANYGLFCLILRIAQEIKPKHVLDIGAGQTTILWDRLKEKGLAGEVVTLEHNAEWAHRFDGKINHELILSPLAERSTPGGVVKTYNWDEVKPKGPFDVIVCDGPVGTAHRSRAGVLNLIDESLPEDFIIILDDAERDGERETVAEISKRLKAQGRKFNQGVIRAAKHQAVFAGGEYSSAAYF